ncbi:hypothetical protein TCAL_03379 [Tigriopus californicus]|uniref:Beta-1,4-glucuronyltransferase 1 n=1 Tax=Tigriopus californicus TaxID=6832 RepID=A0A553P1M5_TIGCA|nr:hypothetical protein TCAL_03379 [Tigriopus californicus]|eukprot:TCALIF_03379-PA protein Name:"Similar to b3gnt1 N-acetyllactosaminide beta-1,3-N-acetylglucosaminyltransferase (Danio rerio)" AED:0.26 eAED:0.26 QI:0/-1/0/1/-1/1/1/0/257
MDWQASQDIIEVAWSPASASRTHFVFNRQYEAAMFHWAGANWSQAAAANESLGIVTMMGLDKLDHLVGLSQQWPGLVSVSVFVPGSDFHLVSVFLYYLELCHSPALANWSIHLVFPSEHPPKTMSQVVFPRTSISCLHSPSDLVGSLVPLRPPSNIASAIPFPQNVMRNVAKSGCPSPFITVLDGDMLPYAEFYGDVQSFLKRPTIQACAKCVYILPVFEVPSGWPLLEQPKNKTDLIEAITQGNAHPFYFEVLPKA